jgi:hypothetical protein
VTPGRSEHTFVARALYLITKAGTFLRVVDEWTEVVCRELLAGKQVKGFLLNEDTYSVQLLTEDGKLCSYEKSAMRMYEIDKHSVMPSYRNSLTEAQLNDLVAFLWSLRPNE